MGWWLRTETVPPDGFSIPLRTLTVVVLPEPLGPMYATPSPGSISKSTYPCEKPYQRLSFRNPILATQSPDERVEVTGMGNTMGGSTLAGSGIEMIICHLDDATPE